jgi:hypothetical protein
VRGSHAVHGIHEVVDAPDRVVGCFIPDWLFEERT